MSDLGPLFDGQGIEFGHLQREAQRRQNAADGPNQCSMPPIRTRALPLRR